MKPTTWRATMLSFIGLASVLPVLSSLHLVPSGNYGFDRQPNAATHQIRITNGKLCRRVDEISVLGHGCIDRSAPAGRFIGAGLTCFFALFGFAVSIDYGWFRSPAIILACFIIVEAAFVVGGG